MKTIFLQIKMKTKSKSSNNKRRDLMMLRNNNFLKDSVRFVKNLNVYTTAIVSANDLIIRNA